MFIAFSSYANTGRRDKISLIQAGDFVMVKVFLLGRPGSGKTTAFHYIEACAHKKKIRSTRFREYTILYNMFQSGRGEFRKAEYGGFDILNFSVVNESAKQLEAEILRCTYSKAQQDELIFIELARDNYEQAMQCFSPSFLQDSYFLFIEADLETCIQRIYYRVAHPAGTDGHFVSEHILRTYYSHDNKNYMATRFKRDYNIQKEVAVIENTGSLDEFLEKLKPFADILLPEKVASVPSL